MIKKYLCKAYGIDWLDEKVKTIFVCDDTQINNGIKKYYTETIDENGKFISGCYTNERYIFNTYDECNKFIQKRHRMKQ